MDVEEFGVNLKGVRELFRSWSQTLMIMSLKENVKMKAKRAYQQMNEILEELKEKKQIDILTLLNDEGDK